MILKLWTVSMVCANLGVTQTSAVIPQPNGLIIANVGETVTLPCSFLSESAMHFSWYKQIFGDKPQLVASRLKYDKNATFYDNFKSNPRLSVETGGEINHLRIRDLDQSDSATYYCGMSLVNIVQFLNSITLKVIDSRSIIQAVVQQPVSESVQPGDSVTLNCTVHTETCDGEHSVYWFRHGRSQPGIIYIHGGSKEQFKRSFEAGSSTQSCVYSLPKKNLSFSDAGTYYCAVASCGEILFGNGTKLEIGEGDFAAQMRILVFLSIIRSGVFLCCLFILSILYMTRK